MVSDVAAPACRRCSGPGPGGVFADLLVSLCEAKAEFLLVGGWAVIMYGHVRATDDMDVFVRPTTTNSERVFAALDRADRQQEGGGRYKDLADVEELERTRES